MNSKLFVGRDEQLHEVPDPETPVFHPALRVAARILTYVFHPAFVPLYAVLFLLYIHPYVFAGFSDRDKAFTLTQAFVNYTFFPIVSVFLLRALNLIPSITLKERRDRIIPFVISNIWYFWIWYVWRNLPETPHELVVFSLGVFLASAIGLLFNIYMKVSMHAIALGVVAAFLIGLSPGLQAGRDVYVSIGLLVTGLVCTSRLILSDHTAGEVYWGLAAGAIAVMLAYLTT